MTNTDDDVLFRLVQWHESADQSSVDARDLAERDRDYVDGKQWTDDEVEKLRRRGQAAVTINRIKPKVDFLKGQEAQRRRMPRAYPRTPAEQDNATAATDALRFVMESSRWNQTRSECFDAFLVEGACGIDVQVYQKPDGEICIDPKAIMWDRMWGDPHSRRRDWSDALYKGQFLWMDIEEAKQKWPEHGDTLDTTLANEGSRSASETYDDAPRTRWADAKRKRVRIAECWSKEEGVWYFTQYTKAGILSRMESPFQDEDGNSDDGFVFGSCFIDRDGNRYGVVRAWISIQDEINKRRSKAMHLMSVRQTWGNPAAGDKNTIRRELARPDGHIEVQGGAKFGEDFGVLPTGDMADAQFRLLQEAKSEIDAVGVNAALSGTEGRVMSGRALMARSEQGLSELGPVFDNFAQFQLDVYRKVWNRIRQLWTDEKWVRVTDDERTVRFVGLNQPLTLGEQLLEEFKKQPGVTPEAIAQAEQQAQMDPAMQQVVGTKNRIAELDVDLVLDDAPAAAALQVEEFEMLANMTSSGVPIPPDVLIEASSLRNKDKLLERLRGGQDGQVPPEVQQAMQQRDEAIAQLQQQLQQAEAQAAASKAAGPAAELERRAMELKAIEQTLAAKERELRLAEENARLRLQLQAEKTGRTTDKLNEAAADMREAAQDTTGAGETVS